MLCLEHPRAPPRSPAAWRGAFAEELFCASGFAKSKATGRTWLALKLSFLISSILGLMQAGERVFGSSLYRSPARCSLSDALSVSREGIYVI